jgi:hypothetical protein
VTDSELVIERQPPRAPANVETWPDKREMVNQPLTDHEISLWNKSWKQVAVEKEMDAGYYPREYGRTNVLQIMPLRPNHPVAIEAKLPVPASSAHPKLTVELASEGQHGDYLVKAFANNESIGECVVRTNGEFVSQIFDLPAGLAGTTAAVRLEFHANDWSVNSGYVRKIEIN